MEEDTKDINNPQIDIGSIIVPIYASMSLPILGILIFLYVHSGDINKESLSVNAHIFVYFISCVLSIVLIKYKKIIGIYLSVIIGFLALFIFPIGTALGAILLYNIKVSNLESYFNNEIH